MKVILNGQPKEFSSSLNLCRIIEQFCGNGQRVVAEVNGDIVKHTNWSTKTINDGDTIELVNIVGGG